MTRGWGSWWDGRSRAPLRVGLAVIAGLVFVSQVVVLSRMAADRAHFGDTGPMHRLLAQAPWLPWLAIAALAPGLWAVARDRRPVAGGAWALGWMSLLSFMHTEFLGSPARNTFFPGVALLGWLLGLVWAREAGGPGLTRDARERFAEAGALACIAAGYVGSASSKLITSGLSWADASTVRALILWQQPFARWPWLLEYRELLLQHGGLARAASASALVIEAGAFFLLFGPRLRLAWTALIIGLHTNIFLLCTMPYPEPMLLLLLFALPWGRWRRGAPAAAEAPGDAEALEAPRIPWTMGWILGALVAIGWLLAPLGWRA